MGLGDNLACNAELGLSLGCRENSADLDYHHRNHKKRRHLKFYDQLLPSDLTLGPSSDEAPDQPKWTSISSSPSGGGGGAVSSFSNSSSTFKREELRADQEVEEIFDDQADQAAGSPRKKLRLTRDQSATLEDSFKQHTTLNPKQKQQLASDLNLQPRQVEVWFQNRRARTKLKQTEANCEMLKKCCENLKEENTRLKQVVQELKAMKQTSAAPFYMQFPTATLTVCPSCTEGIFTGSVASSTSENQNGNGLTKPRLLISSFTHPSKAC